MAIQTPVESISSPKFRQMIWDLLWVTVVALIAGWNLVRCQMGPRVYCDTCVFLDVAIIPKRLKPFAIERLISASGKATSPVIERAVSSRF